jgi:hypothetical protein
LKPGFVINCPLKEEAGGEMASLLAGRKKMEGERTEGGMGGINVFLREEGGAGNRFPLKTE